jgi:hypothetical protein
LLLPPMAVTNGRFLPSGSKVSVSGVFEGLACVFA